MKALELLRKYKASDIALAEDFGYPLYKTFITEIDEAIAELEALESKGYNDCKYYLSQDGKYPIDPCSECSRFYGDQFERKDDEN